jgi:N-succinyldiaminopimelate aminotransferase
MQPASRVQGFGASIFAEFSKLALDYGAVNLGQGFPDFDGPEEVKAVAAQAIADGINQYAVSQGAEKLRTAISKHSARFYGQTIDPRTQVVVTSGATEAIFDAILAFVSPGDEVVVFEPFYDSYVASITMAGGVCRYVRLHAPDASHARFWFDERELASAFSSRTRLVMLNTPHNPTGKVFTAAEITLIGKLATKHDAVIVADEVYEHLVFAPAKHVRVASLFPERTLTISSGGKSFSFTGWKIGWAIGPEPLVSAVQKAHQWVTFASASPFQAAIAHALELPDAYFAQFIAEYTLRRDKLARALNQAGYETLPCEGAYFLMADISKRDHASDVAFCRWLVEHKRVAAIPPSAFYASNKVGSLVRFAFCKSDPLLDEAARRLAT